MVNKTKGVKSMAILTEQAIEGYKQDTEKKIARARYKIGDEYYDAPIHRRERLPDGRVAVYFSITPAMGGATITEVQLIDNNGDLWATKSENIVISGVQEGVLYRFTFDFTEV